MWSSGYGSCLPYSWVLVRSAPAGVLSKICKSPSVVEVLFSALHCGEVESLGATALNAVLLLIITDEMHRIIIQQ
jgi:hypothetical protein